MILIILFLLCGCIIFLLKNLKNKREPPALPGCLPVFGHIFKIMALRSTTEVFEYYKEIAYTLYRDGIGYLGIGPVRAYFITDPEYSFTVSSLCVAKPYVYKLLDPWAKAGIFYSDPPQWNVDRKKWASLLNPRNIDTSSINKNCIQLVNNLAEQVGKEKSRIEPIFTVFTLETVLELIFGMESGDMAAVNSEYREIVERMINMFFARVTNPLLHVPFIYNCSSHKKRYLKLAERSQASIQKRIKDREELLKLNSENSKKNDYRPILDHLLEQNENQRGYTMEELVDHVETIVVAAFDTTARTLVMILLCIGSYPHVQEQVYTELQRVLGDSDRDLVKDDLSGLVYLEAVIKESLRLYPTVPLIGRIPSEEIKLRHNTIPKGGICALFLYGMHRHPVWGADAEQFRPERWLEPNGVPENAFAPFSFGKRTCIGKAVAMMMMKTTLVHVLRRYKVRADVSKIVFEVNMFLSPISGSEVELELRKP